MGIRHFWRKHPPNSGTGLLILGQHYVGNLWHCTAFVCGQLDFCDRTPLTLSLNLESGVGENSIFVASHLLFSTLSLGWPGQLESSLAISAGESGGVTTSHWEGLLEKHTYKSLSPPLHGRWEAFCIVAYCGLVAGIQPLN